MILSYLALERIASDNTFPIQHVITGRSEPVVKAELVYGATKSRVREHTLAKLDRFFAAFESLPFDDRAALNYGQIRTRGNSPQ